MASRRDTDRHLDEMTRKQLLEVASEAKIVGRSRMRKEQLKNTLKRIPGIERLVRLFRREKEAEPDVPPQGEVTPSPLPEGAVLAGGGQPQAGPAGLAAPERRRAAPDEPEPPRKPGAFVGSRLVLMVVDPFSAFAYWDVPPRALERARGWLGDPGAGLVLRVHELTGTGPHARRTGESFDVDVAGASGNHYLNFWSPGKSAVAELGVRSAGGSFLPLVGSNEIELPASSETTVYDSSERQIARGVDPRWRPRGAVESHPTAEPAATHVAEAAVLVDEGDSAPLYARPGARRSAGVAGVRGGGPLELPAEWKLQFGFSSAELAAGGRPGGPVSSLELQRRDARANLIVDAARETILRGRAQPGTDLVIGGVRVPVQADGTFDLRVRPGGEHAEAAPADPETVGRDVTAGLSLQESAV